MERRALAIRGIVQGVGFRPFVYGLASRLALTGFVRNAPDALLIEVEGSIEALNDFETAVTSDPPRQASIDTWDSAPVPLQGDRLFRIESSRTGRVHAGSPQVTPDLATCEACLEELRDPSNRRHGYPFITCAECGPRLTVVSGTPYDRDRTTMRAFAVCPACQDEYDDPVDRRFHAQTISCAACGPRLALLNSLGVLVDQEPIVAAVTRLRAGQIVAVKGLGGYHLACDATNAAAIAMLRERKHRDEKPFAVMFSSLADVTRECDADAVEQALLLSAARPIVLIRRRDSSPIRISASVAPGCPQIGAMLPSTPLHTLLLEAAGVPLVMTSANRSGEPTIHADTDALQLLGGIADAYLTHDRVIHVRCDDSVSRVINGRELPLRRSRGHAPRPMRLSPACAAPLLAVGAQLKNTFALASHHNAVISHHIGDLDDLAAYRAFAADIALYEDLFEIAPQLLVHDSHPAYASTRYAQERAARHGLSTLAVQHHHAHVASCLAEHGLSGPVIGVAFDGTGYGTDGTMWGGEFLVGDLGAVERMAYLRPVAMPGGEQAIREPWRMALAHLLDAAQDIGELQQRHGSDKVRILEQMIERGLNAPMTSSAGRLFDAIAAIAGVRDAVSFEGQAAMQLEWLAAGVPISGTYDTAIDERGSGLCIDTRPIIAAAARDASQGSSPAQIARRFHSTMTSVVVAVTSRLREMTGIDRVVLTGGVFQNALLATECDEQLQQSGFRVYQHHLVPPNDGGISLGQLAVAAARSQRCA
ncbi:MAG TPA: carbamoyltransferase HypF [Vicinamibacterales bacterium]|nr:carbamoyltransferase HypF [Vicinamibacterales bacterium]